jgi:hypothetical protein
MSIQLKQGAPFVHRLALRNAAAEIGLQLIMTFVDADAVPGPGVTVMVAGEAAKAEERRV